MVGGVELEIAPIPAHAAIAVALVGIGFLIERLFHCPVMRKVDDLPCGIVEDGGRRAPRDSRFGIVIGSVLSGDDGEGDIALVEQPAFVEREAFAHWRSLREPSDRATRRQPHRREFHKSARHVTKIS